MKTQSLPYFLGIALIACLSVNAFGQDELFLYSEDERSTDRRGKFYLVPELGLWLGNYTHVEVAPVLGYHLTDRLSVGAGGHYMYYRNRDYFSSAVSYTHIYGIRTFSRVSVIRDAADFLPFYLFDELFLHGEYERMNLDNNYFNFPNLPFDKRFWTDYLYVGFGITQRVGQFSSYSILLLWNLYDSFYSLYSNPTYRIGLNLYF